MNIPPLVSDEDKTLVALKFWKLESEACYWRIKAFLATYSNDCKRPNEKRFEIRNNKKYKLTKCKNIKLKSDLKRNAMNTITENLHCIDAVGRERATLCTFITQDVSSLTSTVRLNTAACAKIIKLEY